MTGRHWLRKDVLLPIFYLLVFGALLYGLFSLTAQIPARDGAEIIRYGKIAMAVIYLLLIIITFRHVVSTYDLERYDPGNPASLKRLMRRSRYRLQYGELAEARLLTALEQSLLDQGYRLESESHLIGRIYRLQNKTLIFRRNYSDRIIILQHEPLNVLTVDQILQDAIRHLHSLDQPSARNLLILVTRMSESQDAASAAAGIVNFLGKFSNGSLCPLLLATRQHRLFYPADRTLLPRSHRHFQNFHLRRLRVVIKAQAESGSAPHTQTDEQ